MPNIKLKGKHRQEDIYLYMFIGIHILQILTWQNILQSSLDGFYPQVLKREEEKTQAFCVKTQQWQPILRGILPAEFLFTNNTVEVNARKSTLLSDDYDKPRKDYTTHQQTAHTQTAQTQLDFLFFLCCTWPTDCLNSKDNKPLTTECPRQMHSNREINQYKCKNSLRWGWNNYQNTESTYRKKFLSHARLQVTCKKTNFKEKVVQTSMKTWATIW